MLGMAWAVVLGRSQPCRSDCHHPQPGRIPAFGNNAVQRHPAPTYPEIMSTKFTVTIHTEGWLVLCPSVAGGCCSPRYSHAHRALLTAQQGRWPFPRGEGAVCLISAQAPCCPEGERSSSRTCRGEARERGARHGWCRCHAGDVVGRSHHGWPCLCFVPGGCLVRQPPSAQPASGGAPTVRSDAREALIPFSRLG